MQICTMLTKLLRSLHGVDNTRVKTVDFLRNRGASGTARVCIRIVVKVRIIRIPTILSTFRNPVSGNFKTG